MVTARVTLGHKDPVTVNVRGRTVTSRAGGTYAPTPHGDMWVTGAGPGETVTVEYDPADQFAYAIETVTP